MEAETTESAFASVLNVCGVCKQNLQGREPKLLSCLHVFCKQCVLNIVENGSLVCPTCRQECPANCVIDNLFINSLNMGSGSTSDGQSNSNVDDQKTCTACEEGTPVSSYCVDCADWLCEQCVQAHRRVRVTKDHVIQPKDATAGSDTKPPPHSLMMHCKTHKSELLQLFCETCDVLTCRDCQLHEHRDHKYLFVDEAAHHYKTFLQTLVSKLREKRVYVENAKTLIKKRNTEITEREQKVMHEIKVFALRIIAQVNKRGKELLGELNAICSAKRSQLDEKGFEVQTLSTKLDHALKFSEFALERDDHGGILYTKRVLVSQLKNILRSRCEVPNPYHVVDIRFSCDPSFPIMQIPQQGMIVVDGIPYQTPSHNPGQSQQQQPLQQHHMQMSQRSSSAGSSQGPMGRTSVANLSDISPEQRNALLMRMKQLHHQQQQQQQQQQHRRLSPSAGSSPTSTITGMAFPHGYPPNSNNHMPPRFNHLPNQSSNISSSNPHLAKTGNPYFQTGGYPPLHPKPGDPGPGGVSMPQQQLNRNMINLAQLQQHRMHRYGNGTGYQPATMQNPIVIKPTDPTDQLQQLAMPPGHCIPGMSVSVSPVSSMPPVPGSHIITPDCIEDQMQYIQPSRHHRSTAMKQELSDRPSCSFAGQMSVKQEAVSPELGLPMNANDLNFDADPASFLESIKKEMPNLAADDITMCLGASAAGSRTPTPRAESTSQDLPHESSSHDGTHNPTTVDTANVTSENMELHSETCDTSLSSSPQQEATPCKNGSTDHAAPSNSATGNSVGSKSATGNSMGSNSATGNSMGSNSATGNSMGKTIEASAAVTEQDTDRPDVSGCRLNSTKDGQTYDGSEDYCAVCHNGGDLLCCDNCPKVFHVQCHIPALVNEPSGTWHCGLCTKEEDVRLEAPEVHGEPPSGLSGATKRKAATGMTQRELKVCEHILLQLFCHEASTPFHVPVSKSVPNYYKIISNPIDFRTIQSKLSRDHFNNYQSIDEFLRDIRLVFVNCARYNHKDSEVGKVGLAVEDFVEQLIGRVLPFVDYKAIPSQVEDVDKSLSTRLKRRKKSEDSKPDRHSTTSEKSASSEKSGSSEKSASSEKSVSLEKTQLSENSGHSSDSQEVVADKTNKETDMQLATPTAGCEPAKTLDK